MANQDQVKLLTTASTSICLFIILIFLIQLLYQFYCKKHAKQMLNFYIFTHIIFFIGTIAATTGDLLHALISYLNSYTLLSYSNNPYMILADIGYFIATIVLYILLFGRLYFTFDQTSYKLSKCIVIFYIIVIIESSVMFGLYFYVWYDSGLIVILLLMVMTVNDLILNITLTVLFINKIKTLVVTEFEVSMDADTQIERDSEITFNKRQYKMINLITKYGILSILIIVLKQEFNLWYLFQLVVLDTSNENVAVGCSLRGVENVINVVILYIGLHFNGNLYERLCGKCHRCCLKCCTRRLKGQIRKMSMYSYKRMNDSDDEQDL